MAGTIIDMSKIKQLLHLKKAGVSNRQIAKDLKMSRDKANEYVNRAESDPLGIDGLLKLDNPVLEKRFHPGNPAYTDERMETFLELLPDFVEQLSHKHVTRQLVWEDYKRMHPDGYEKSQFYFHLAQNLKAQKAPTSALLHDPGKELFVDFAGDTLGYVDVETGEPVKVQTFVSTMACTDYTFALCVPSQKTEDFLHALGKALEFYGGVPRIVVPDNLKAASIYPRGTLPRGGKAGASPFACYSVPDEALRRGHRAAERPCLSELRQALLLSAIHTHRMQSEDNLFVNT